MSRTLLRTLTEKSKFGFGKYAQRTVAEVLHNGNREYLFWVYYNCSNITFTDELLDKINLTASRIEKPGKNPELHIRRPVNYKNTMRQLKQDAHYRKTKKVSTIVRQIGRERSWFNKSSLAWKNQGH